MSMSEIERPREFGTLVGGADYVLRPGGYAVIRRATGEIAVVTTAGGCFLPGGGQQSFEKPHASPPPSQAGAGGAGEAVQRLPLTPRGACPSLSTGGQDHMETLEQAAIRETHEECGLQIRIGTLIGIADQLVYAAAEATHFRKRCCFFLAEVIASDGTSGEADHVLSWLTPEEAVRRLSHESQRWAVAKACHVAHHGHVPQPPA